MMKRAEWIKDLIMHNSESPLGTPQFSVSKGIGFKYTAENIPNSTDNQINNEREKHESSLIPACKLSEKKATALKIPKSQDKSTETIEEIHRIRENFTESITKIRKQYLQKERKIFAMLKNEEELHLLIGTRPKILEMPSKISTSPIMTPEPRFIDDYRASYSQKIKNPKSTPRDLENSYESVNIESLNSSKIQKTSKSLENDFAETLKNKEYEIRQIYEKIYDEKKYEVMETKNAMLNEIICQIEVELENDWKNKISDLKACLKSKENEKMQGHQQRGQQEAELAYEENKQQLIEELEESIEKSIKAQYLQKKSKIKQPQLTKREKENKIMKLQAEIEIEQIEIMNKEKEFWKNELIHDVHEICKQKLKEEHESLITRKEKELKKQAENEKNDVISRLVRDSQEAVDLKIQRISEDRDFSRNEIFENLKQECLNEIIKENELKFKENTRAKIKNALEKDLRKSMSTRIEMEVKIRLEDLIYQELNQEFEIFHENFRKKIENDHYLKILSLEEQFENNRSKSTSEFIEKNLAKIEKDLKITYLKKIDKLKSEIRKEYEEIFIGQIKKIRGLLCDEKSATARIKSKINVYLSRATSEKQSELKNLQQQEELFGRKVRDISIRQQYENEHSQMRFTPELSKSPFRKNPSIYSVSPIMNDSEMVKVIPKPLPPPELASLNDDVKKRSVSPERKLLKNYDTKEIASQLILKNFQDAQQKAWTTLKETDEPKIETKSLLMRSGPRFTLDESLKKTENSYAEHEKKVSLSPERKLLKNYNTKEVVSQLILKNYEEAQKKAWVTLKETEEPRPKSSYAEISELLSTGKSLQLKEPAKRQSLYNELLKKKYGVIEPRTIK